MNLSKTTKLATVLVAGMLALSGCASNGYTKSGQAINVVTVDLPAGGSVVCVSVDKSVDCDWDGANR